MLKKQMSYQIFNENFYKYLPTVEDKSVDLFLLDLPYNILQNKNKRADWDQDELDLVFIWDSIERILKPNSVVACFCNQPFTTKLMANSPKFGETKAWFKHHWIWNKVSAGNGLLAKYQPLKIHEEIVVFMNGKSKYFPVMTPSKSRRRGGGNVMGTFGTRPTYERRYYDEYFPKTIQTVSRVHSSKRRHLTEKPVELLEYFIKTYSIENDLVMDFAMGSGSCGEACFNTNRNFIGVEKDVDIFTIAKERLENLRLKND